MRRCQQLAFQFINSRHLIVDCCSVYLQQNLNFNQMRTAGDSKSKKKGSADDKSQKSGKSKSKEKEPAKSPSKSPSKKEKEKQKDPKAKKTGTKGKKDDQSDISSIIPSAPPSADCVHHKSPFIYYCETCQQLICNQCTVYGPHNNHLHRILKITDAYRSRVYYLSEAIRTNLVDKRDKIIAQLHRLEYRVEEIRFVKNIIARDIRSEYSGIGERLRNVEGVKLAELSHEMALGQREVDTVNQIGNSFFELTSMEGDQATKDRNLCKFLLKSKKMYEAVEYMLAKAERPLPDVRSEQLPRQLEQGRSQIQKALAAKQINDFKNEVIFNLAKQLKDQQKRIKAEVETKADSMIRGLSDQAEALNTKLNQYKMVCFYCGVRLNPQAVKEGCESNKASGSTSVMENNSKVEKAPPQNYRYNGRHFFSKVVGEELH